MSNKNPYSNVTKYYPWPKDLRKDIAKLEPARAYRNYYGLHMIEYANYYSMLDGKPLKRVFAFAYSSTYKTKEKKLYIKEVARFYDHHQFLNPAIYMTPGGKRVEWGVRDNHFYMWPEKNNSPSRFWDFYPQHFIQNLYLFLADNKLLYTGWNADIKLDFNEYLTYYLENPKIELLAKAGLDKWIKYIDYLDTSKKNVHEIFKIKKECVPLLKNKDFNYKDLLSCRKSGITDISIYIVQRDIESLKRNLNIHQPEIKEVLSQEKTFKYLVEQNKIDHFCTFDYYDYLKDLLSLGAINDPKQLYPKDFQKAHADAAVKVKVAKSQELIEGFEKSYKKHSKFSYESGGLLIRPVETIEELYRESQELHHCVRTYDKNVAAGTTEIMFIREVEHPDTPFFTLELKNKKVIQVRGEKNKNPGPDIESFVSKWAGLFNIDYSGKQVQFNYGYY